MSQKLFQVRDKKGQDWFSGPLTEVELSKLSAAGHTYVEIKPEDTVCELLSKVLKKSWNDHHLDLKPDGKGAWLLTNDGHGFRLSMNQVW